MSKIVTGDTTSVRCSLCGEDSPAVIVRLQEGAMESAADARVGFTLGAVITIQRVCGKRIEDTFEEVCTSCYRSIADHLKTLRVPE